MQANLICVILGALVLNDKGEKLDCEIIIIIIIFSVLSLNCKIGRWQTTLYVNQYQYKNSHVPIHFKPLDML